MDFPERTKQKQSEAHSYAILLYKLRKVGIFRNVTESDYGIDFEIELVKDGKVTGRYFKAQVKSSEDIYVRQSDSVPTVGNIKQSTLAYWCELSYRTHVVAYAVDLTTEDVYVSRPLFWQATKLFDGTTTSKTIEFLPRAHGVTDGSDVLIFSLLAASEPSVADQLYAQSTALRYLERYLRMSSEAHALDPALPLDEPELFRSLLEVCSILLWGRDLKSKFKPEDEGRIYSYDHWVAKAGGDELVNMIARDPLDVLLPVLVGELEKRRKLVLDGLRWWVHRDRQFLRLVYETPLPPAVDRETLIEWGERYADVARAPALDISLYISDKLNG